MRIRRRARILQDPSQPVQVHVIRIIRRPTMFDPNHEKQASPTTAPIPLPRELMENPPVRPPAAGSVTAKRIRDRGTLRHTVTSPQEPERSALEFETQRGNSWSLPRMGYPIEKLAQKHKERKQKSFFSLFIFPCQTEERVTRSN